MRIAQKLSIGHTARGRGGFTLTEVIVATTVLGLAVGMTMGVFIAALRRAQHTELGLKGTAELRYAADVISETVRSASLDLTVAGNGTQLIVAPAELGYAIVQDGTWLDGAHTVQGWKSNQHVLKLADVTVSSVVRSAWKANGSGAVAATRPSGAISAGDIGTYFVTLTDLTNSDFSMDLHDIFTEGDTITIPATAFGARTQVVVKQISNNAGTKTFSLDNALGVDVPNGTKILATSGPRAQFEVLSDGTLVYYPDNRKSAFTVLARDITTKPLSDPANSSSATTVPFTKLATGYVQINLQKVPAGTDAGRTLQGVQTTAYVRSTTSDL